MWNRVLWNPIVGTYLFLATFHQYFICEMYVVFYGMNIPQLHTITQMDTSVIFILENIYT